MKTLIGLWLICAIAVTVLGQKQDDIKIVSRIPNVSRIQRNWNAIAPLVKEWNDAMTRADALIHERFNPKVLVANPDEQRKQYVAELKAARETLIKTLEATNELIDEDDY